MEGKRRVGVVCRTHRKWVWKRRVKGRFAGVSGQGRHFTAFLDIESESCLVNRFRTVHSGPDLSLIVFDCRDLNHFVEIFPYPICTQQKRNQKRKIEVTKPWFPMFLLVYNGYTCHQTITNTLKS
ncbi:hypothetical protein VNO80_20473 [Phaseolus coccineus]|uniref:Uncharacterized protein n=1 Tax=Phaseolus coccineus TaxID=3886 RepID=A0AAN9M0M2_PHACN